MICNQRRPSSHIQRARVELFNFFISFSLKVVLSPPLTLILLVLFLRCLVFQLQTRVTTGVVSTVG